MTVSITPLLAVEQGYLDTIARLVEDRTVTNVPGLEKTVVHAGQTIKTALVEGRTGDYFVVYAHRQGRFETLARLAVSTSGFANRTVTTMEFFRGAPLMIEYLATTRAGDANQSVRARFLFVEDGLELVYYLEAIAPAGDGEDLTLVGRKAQLEAKQRSDDFTIIARQYIGERNFNAAIEAYQQSIEAYPANAVTYRELGALYKNLGTYSLAEMNLLFALTANPTDVAAYELLQETYTAQGDHLMARNVEWKLNRLAPRRNR